MHFKCQVPRGSANYIPGNLHGGMERMSSYLRLGGPQGEEGCLLTRHQGEGTPPRPWMALHPNTAASSSQPVYRSPGSVLAVPSESLGQGHSHRQGAAFSPTVEQTLLPTGQIRGTALCACKLSYIL